MCFSEPEIELKFKEALITSMSFLELKKLSLSEIDRLNERRVKGKHFLKSIKELKKLAEITTDPFYDGFLNAATATLLSPTETNYKQMYLFFSKLKNTFADPCEHSKVTCAWNIANHSFYALCGVAGSLMGAYGIASAILGTVTLSMGPWGLATLGVAFMIASTIVLMISFYFLCMNIRFVADSQLEEITEFVECLKPLSLKIEALSLEANDGFNDVVKTSC